MSFAAGHSRAAQSAATTEMNPSTTAATPSRAQPRNAPVIAARSSPPTMDSTATGSFCGGRCRSSAC